MMLPWRRLRAPPYITIELCQGGVDEPLRVSSSSLYCFWLTLGREIGSSVQDVHFVLATYERAIREHGSTSFCAPIMSVSSVYASSMRFLAFVAILAALMPSMLTQAHSSSASTAMNQPSSSPASPSSSNLLPTLPTSTSPEIPPAVTHKIRVGLGDHKFTPDTVTAAQGDVRYPSFRV